MHPHSELRARLIAETREKIAASITAEELIIQAITSVEQLEQGLNRLLKKGREWYALRNPEFEHRVKDHQRFLEEALAAQRPEKSMGGDLDEQDREAIATLLEGVQELSARRETLLQYIEKKMQTTAPNITLLAGSRIGAQLLSLAGSLNRLATMPSSTVQLLGAETALFRHLRNRKKHRAPKYGILYNHPLVQHVEQRQRGKAARMLADKLSICAKIDRFKGEPQAAQYKKALEARFGAWE